jgi:hypothetical protein
LGSKVFSWAAASSCAASKMPAAAMVTRHDWFTTPSLAIACGMISVCKVEDNLPVVVDLLIGSERK